MKTKKNKLNNDQNEAALHETSGLWKDRNDIDLENYVKDLRNDLNDRLQRLYDQEVI